MSADISSLICSQVAVIKAVEQRSLHSPIKDADIVHIQTCLDVIQTSGKLLSSDETEIESLKERVSSLTHDDVRKVREIYVKTYFFHEYTKLGCPEDKAQVLARILSIICDDPTDAKTGSILSKLPKILNPMLPIEESLYESIRILTEGLDLEKRCEILEAISKLRSNLRIHVCLITRPFVVGVPRADDRIQILERIERILPGERGTVGDAIYPLVQGKLTSFKIAMLEAIANLPPGEKESICSAGYPLVKEMATLQEKVELLKFVGQIPFELRESICKLILPPTVDATVRWQLENILRAIDNVPIDTAESILRLASSFMQWCSPYKVDTLLSAIKRIPLDKQRFVCQLALDLIEESDSISVWEICQLFDVFSLFLMITLKEDRDEYLRVFFTLKSQLNISALIAAIYCLQVFPKHLLSDLINVILACVYEDGEGETKIYEQSEFFDRIILMRIDMIDSLHQHLQHILASSSGEDQLLAADIILGYGGDSDRLLLLQSQPLALQLAHVLIESWLYFGSINSGFFSLFKHISDRESLYAHMLGILSNTFDPTRKSKIAHLIYDRKINLLLHEEHPLVQAAIDAIILTDDIANPKNPFAVYRKILESARKPTPVVPIPAQELGVLVATFNPECLIKTRRVIPKAEVLEKCEGREFNSTMLYDMVQQMEDRIRGLDPEENTKLRDEIKAMTNGLYLETLSANWREPTFTGVLDRPYEDEVKVDKAYLCSILQYISALSTQLSDTRMLDEQKERLKSLLRELPLGVISHEEQNELIEMLSQKGALTCIQKERLNQSVAALSVKEIDNELLIEIIRLFSEIRKHSLLSLREEALIMISAAICHCKTGKEAGIVKVYTSFLPREMRYNLPISDTDDPEVAPVINFILDTLGAYIEEQLNGDSPMMREMTGVTSGRIGQLVHQTLYVKNLLAQHLHLAHTNTFDSGTHTLYDRLINRSLDVMLSIFYKHLSIKDLIRELQRAFSRLPLDSERKSYYNAICGKSELLKGIDMDEVWEICTDEKDPFSLKEKGALLLLEKAGAVAVSEVPSLLEARKLHAVIASLRAGNFDREIFDSLPKHVKEIIFANVYRIETEAGRPTFDDLEFGRHAFYGEGRGGDPQVRILAIRYYLLDMMIEKAGSFDDAQVTIAIAQLEPEFWGPILYPAMNRVCGEPWSSISRGEELFKGEDETLKPYQLYMKRSQALKLARENPSWLVAGNAQTLDLPSNDDTKEDALIADLMSSTEPLSFRHPAFDRLSDATKGRIFYYVWAIETKAGRPTFDDPEFGKHAFYGGIRSVGSRTKLEAIYSFQCEKMIGYLSRGEDTKVQAVYDLNQKFDFPLYKFLSEICGHVPGDNLHGKEIFLGKNPDFRGEGMRQKKIEALQKCLSMWV